MDQKVDLSTPTVQILIIFSGGCLARHQLSNGIRYISVTSKPMNPLSTVEGEFGSQLAIFYLMADYSTTAGCIFIVFAVNYCGQRQLPNRYKVNLCRIRDEEIAVFTGECIRYQGGDNLLDGS